MPSPISTTVSSPQYVSAGCSRWQGFSSPKVTVRSRDTAASGTAPVSAATPEGRSTATTGIFRAATDWTRSATRSGNPGRPPMPRIPSITRSKARLLIEPCEVDELSASRNQRGVAGGMWGAQASHRGDAYAAAGEPYAGKQGVAPVIARADHDHHVAAVPAAGRRLQ